MFKADNIPRIAPPGPYRGLGLIFRRRTFMGWVTFWGWQPRYLLAENWLLAEAAGEWVDEREFEKYTGLVRPTEYRVDWLA